MKLDKRGWILFSAWFVLITLLVMASLPPVAAAAPLAQVTSTPGPDTSYYYELSSGNSIEIERTISYGQIGIMAALGLVAGLLFLKGLFYLVVHYLY